MTIEKLPANLSAEREGESELSQEGGGRGSLVGEGTEGRRGGEEGGRRGRGSGSHPLNYCNGCCLSQ